MRNNILQMRNNILSRNVPMYVLEVTFNLALLACIRQDKEDVLEALLPQVEHNDNAMMATLIAITIIIMISIAIKNSLTTFETVSIKIF